MVSGANRVLNVIDGKSSWECTRSPVRIDRNHILNCVALEDSVGITFLRHRSQTCTPCEGRCQKDANLENAGLESLIWLTVFEVDIDLPSNIAWSFDITIRIGSVEGRDDTIRIVDYGGRTWATRNGIVINVFILFDDRISSAIPSMTHTVDIYLAWTVILEVEGDNPRIFSVSAAECPLQAETEWRDCGL